MRAASKPVKHQAYSRRKLLGKIDGFTIIETMIVLAVTAALFLLAVIAVGGRQNETEFQQAVNDVGSTFQQIINQVRSGNYQEAQKVTCQNSGGKPDVQDASSSTTDTEGTSTDCVFIGKVVQFDTQNADPQQYIVYPIAGLRKDPFTGLNCTDIDCTDAQAVAPDNAGNNAFPDDGVAKFLHNGLSVVSMKFKNGASSQDVGAFGVLGSLGANPGSQQFYLVPVKSTNTNYDPTNDVDRKNSVKRINQHLINSYDDVQAILNSSTPDYDVEICLASGTTKQSGLITIGGNGGDLNSVTTAIYSNTSCS